jgi:hypothetical protein
MSDEQPTFKTLSPAENDYPITPLPLITPETQSCPPFSSTIVPADINTLPEEIEGPITNETADHVKLLDQEGKEASDPDPDRAQATDSSTASATSADSLESTSPTAPTLTPKREDNQDQNTTITDLDSNPDGLSAPFQSALTKRFDKVPVVWGKEALPISLAKFQSRLKQRLALTEIRRVADQNSKEPSVGVSADLDKQSKPERANKYRPVINMYQRKPAVSKEQLTELIWGSYEQRTIVSSPLMIHFCSSTD